MAQAGDRVVDGLQSALESANGDPELAQVWEVVQIEILDRRLRDVAFARAHLHWAADFLALIGDEAGGELVRRRCDLALRDLNDPGLGVAS